jgi:class 3 adenylate cyclase/tetratricopeptide (TPR) repeat protein
LDVATWLRGLGLGQYERAFLDQDIDGDVLLQLTADDLVAVGVASVGHRRKLLAAIAALQEPLPVHNDSPVAPPREAERRQLTVLFCDLAGSTALSRRLDPEDMGGIIRAYHGSAAAVIERWGGHLAKYLGDGVLAYFGWPRAHEDDAERAVRAGLELAAAVGQIAADGEALAARIGIATGLVMVGEAIGKGAAQEEAVVGETPNLAARLQAEAAPGGVVIAEATRRLVGGLFELANLGPQRLKGFAEPLRAWRVEGEGRAEGRFEALRGARLTPLIGREHELELLLERWERACDGEGQVVLLAGEPGIGKSRLVRALRERLSGQPHVSLSHFCSPYHQNTALHPVIGLLEHAAELSPADSPDVRLAKLEALLARSNSRLDAAVPLLAALLAIPSAGRWPRLELTPQRQKQMTLEALLDQLEGLARAGPVLAVYEDVHWVDPTTLELLGLLVERVRALPVLALLTFRPEFQSPWGGEAHITTLSLTRLTRRLGAAMVERLTGAKPLPAAVVERIIERTDGVPLFVEELTKAVIESGLVRDAGDRWEPEAALRPVAIPATLHDSLMARLDRLAPVKEVAQIGAVIGRQFDYRLLAAVAGRPEEELLEALDQVVASGLVFARGTPPEAGYTFKHALVQGAAYESLLRSRRQILHARIAAALEEQFPERETVPELLAHHHTAAGQGEPAVRYWLAAGRRAAGRSAYEEAVAHLRQGLDALALLPPGRERDLFELDLQIALGTRLMALSGWTAPDVVRAWTRARGLCELSGDTERRATVLWGQSVVQYVGADFATAVQTGEELLHFARARGQLVELVIAHRTLGHILTHISRFDQARWHLEQTAAIGARAEAGTFAGHAYEPVVASRTYLARCLLHSGWPEQSAQLLERALAEADRLAHLPTVAFVLLQVIELGYERRQPELTRAAVERLIPLAREQGYSQWLAMAVAMEGWLTALAGEPGAGCAAIRQGQEAWEGPGNLLMRPFFFCLLADAHIHGEEAEEALRAVADGLAFIASNGEVLWEPELHRLGGEAWLLLLHGHDQAQACYTRALEVARGQEARLSELRAATALARLWARQGRRLAARDLLAPLYAWFSEGFETPDLADANMVLDELA